MIRRLVVVALVMFGLFGAVALETPWLAYGSAPRAVRRVQGYEVGSGLDPEIVLPGDDAWVRLVLYPLDDVPVERQFEVDILRPSAPVEARSFALSARPADPIFPSVFDHRDTTVGEGERVDLVFDPPLPPGTRLRLRSPDGRMWARAFSWRARPAERARQRLETVDELRAEWLASVGLRSWDHADPDEVDRAAAAGFAALPAAGRAGTHHRTATFFVRSGARARAAAHAPTVRLLTWVLPPAVAHTLRVEPSEATLPATVRVRRGGVAGAILAETTVGPSGEPQVWTLSPFDAQDTLVVQVEPPTALGVSVLDPAPVDPGGHTVWVTPVGPGEPVVLDVDRPQAPVGRFVEIEWWGHPEDREATLTINIDGRQEAATVALPENLYDSRSDAAGVERPVSGPGRVRVLIPPEARTFAITSPDGGWARLRHPTGSSDLPGAEIRWIGDPSAEPRASWVVPLSPRASEPIRVRSRLEPAAAAPVAPMGRVATALEPSPALYRGEILEASAPGEGAWTQLRGAVKVVAAADGTRADLSFEVVDRGALGSTVPISLDGTTLGQYPLAMTRGRIPLPPLSVGVHTLDARPPPGVELHVDLPPAAGEAAGAVRPRSVFRVDRPVDVWVRVDARGPRALDVVVYHPAAGSPEARLTTTVDGGSPRTRASGTFTRQTPARRVHALPPASTATAARLVDGDRSPIGLPRTVVVPLGDDLEPGLHRVTLDPSEPLWLRAFSFLPSQPPRRAAPDVRTESSGVEP